MISEYNYDVCSVYLLHFTLFVYFLFFFFFQAEDGIRDDLVTGVQTCALPIWLWELDLEPNKRRIEDLDKETHKYWRKVRKAHIRHQNAMSKLRFK